MENLFVLTQCEDKTCCCLSLRTTSTLISLIGLISCFLEVIFNDSSRNTNCVLKEYICSLKTLLLSLFQMANMMLFLGSICENALLLQMYIWCVLSFILLGFVVTIMEFCARCIPEGVWSFTTFIPDVVFFFVLFRCLPLVDDYKKQLD